MGGHFEGEGREANQNVGRGGVYRWTCAGSIRGRRLSGATLVKLFTHMYLCH